MKKENSKTLRPKLKHPRDEGVAYCEAQPNLIVAAVWSEAQIHYAKREDQVEFVNGYIDARRRMDENRRDG
jgi:hypothetical protein